MTDEDALIDAINDAWRRAERVVGPCDIEADIDTDEYFDAYEQVHHCEVCTVTAVAEEVAPAFRAYVAWLKAQIAVLELRIEEAAQQTRFWEQEARRG